MSPRFACVVACLAAVCWSAAAGMAAEPSADRPAGHDAPRPRKIVLIAGPITGHPKDAHEYEKTVILLKHLLEAAPSLRGLVRVEAHFKGWPADERTLDDADTVFMATDGGDHRLEDHPLHVGKRIEALERQMRRGCGLVQFHWSTFHPVREDQRISDWVGGYFDYETGKAPNKWRSAITTRSDWRVTPNASHPIARGVKPFQLKEEFYHRIRFREGDPRLSPIATVGPDATLETTVGWAVQRGHGPDGGRGFGFTGGHFFENWWNEDFRTLLLNAIVWTAHIEVPEGGVRTGLEPRFQALILTGHNHPAHDWRATTAALVGVLEQDPRVKVTVSEDPEDLATKLAGVRLLVLNYCNWDRPGLSEPAKLGLLRHVHDGGGLAVVHFANGAFHASLPSKGSDWPGYRELVRRVWVHGEGRSGHDALGPFKVEVTAANHPITSGLAAFETTDELYFKQEGKAPIEPLATARSKATGQDEPMAFGHEVGKGRVFQTVLGHDAKAIRLAGALIRRGSVWAAKQGHLSWDPPASITEGMLFRAGSPWTPAPKPVAKPVPQAAATPTPALAAAPPAAPKAKAAPKAPAEAAGQEAPPWKQGEKDWVDDRWSKTDLGSFFSCSIKVAGRDIAKGIVVRVGAQDEGAVCFDASTLGVAGGWTGGFVKLDGARYGLISGPHVGGAMQFATPAGPGWQGEGADQLRYRGLYPHGKRVVLSYEVAGRAVLESPWAEPGDGFVAMTRTFEFGPSGKALRVVLADEKAQVALVGDAGLFKLERGKGTTLLVVPAATATTRVKVLVAGAAAAPEKLGTLAKASPAPEDLAALSKPGQPRWPGALVTQGRVSTAPGPYVVDTVTLPFENPNHALFFLGGHDFLSASEIAVGTVHGDVWVAGGIDDKLERITWRRFATGLYQPLGLKVVNGKVHVLGRDQITVLHDRNGDGEADHYECFSNLIQTSAGRHDYAACLETDAAGNFHYVDPRGVHRISKDGSARTTLATGFRNPNGMSVGPAGEVTVAPQQGNWTPSSMICLVKPDGYHGFGGPRVTPARPLGYDPPLCFIPHHVDNSTGGQVWVTSERWGPLRGQLLNLSFGMSAVQLVLRDQASATPQGALLNMKVRCSSGIMRGRFSPFDGQLYVTGMRGWQTNAVHDGCLERVRYTGRKVYLPVGWQADKEALVLRFAEPLDREVAEDPQSYAVEEWNYQYSGGYGSKEYSVAKPGTEGHDVVPVKAAKLLPDAKGVRLELPGLRPAMQVKVKYDLEAADGEPVRGEVFGTIHP